MSDIFDNAIDSLRMGIGYYLHGEFETAYKHSILYIFHSIELLLKEKLYRVNPILIYKNIDKPITDDSITVSLKEILPRFRNLSISLDEVHKNILNDLQRRRNKIEHHKFEKDDSHFYVIGKSLKFLYYFLPEHLNTNLEDHLDNDVFPKVRDIILQYNEKLAEAEEEIKKRTTPKSKDDLCNPTCSGDCPICGNHSVVIGTERGDFCFFCHTKVSMKECDFCGAYFGSESINELGMCEYCYSAKFDD
jgi:hypothetical protein